ncbi:lysM domain receptor-like kinase 3 [Typha angustifolia]|uniref:lysM domain receptor-like kinase 3 n=1 Tax=Typha angustifolia TaxID=59011 RepID=UPI003C2DEF20
MTTQKPAYLSALTVVSRASLVAVRESLPEAAVFYHYSEISAATNQFRSNALSSSSWRCVLRGRDATVYRSRFISGDPADIPHRFSRLAKGNHSSLLRLIGASLAGDEHLYLAYEFCPGASLADCLRNSRNASFTPLSIWISRIQIAADIADGLEYIHHQSNTIHNRIKSSGIIITDPGHRAKICHFGAADLAGEVRSREPDLKRSSSRRRKIEGSRGYMAPEVIASGEVSPRSDVYAFGVVLLEIISGEEPIKYRFDEQSKESERISLIETATAAVEAGRVRQWVDRRLRDSFPVEAAEELIAVALHCMDPEPDKRPDMTWVAAKISKLFLDSNAWMDKLSLPTEISLSIAPR